MPPEAIDDDRRSYAVVAKSFTELIEHVHHWRTALGGQAQPANIGQFACPLTIEPRNGTERFYALGTYAGSKDHTILYADIPIAFLDERGTDAAATVGEKRPDSLVVVEWKPLLRVNQDSWQYQGMLTKEEELMRERMRCMTRGITSYDYEPTSGTFLFSANGHLYRCTDDQQSVSVCPAPVDVPLNVSGAPLDPKICPANPHLVACVCRNDLYVQFGPTARQATFSHELDDDSGSKLCGVPSFIIQEEFDRYSGYWWRPVVEDDTYYVLFEETDESSVLELSINVPATRAEHVEMMRYPRTGTNNPNWAIKMLRVHLFEKSDENFDSVKDARIDECHFVGNFREMFPWAEYLARAGWTPDGKGIWFQIMSRIQDRLVLAYAPLESFRVPGEQCGKSALKGNAQFDTSMEDLTNSEQAQQLQSSNAVVLYEEHTPESWINYHDALQFLNTSDGEFEFLWLSGKSGFYHLYHIISSASTAVGCSPLIHREVQLTSGDWNVRRRCQLHIDQKRKLVFFSAFKDSHLESHIYATSYKYPGALRLLTETGYTYGGQKDGRPFCLSADGKTMVTSRCSLTQVGECVVYALTYASADDNCLPESSALCRVSKTPGFSHLANAPAELNSDNSELPVLFTYDSQRTGFRHYAYLFKPRHAKPGFKYPTILYVYAGPEVQLVKNVWMGSYGFQKYTSLGYAVVIADGRGSANRGVQFEMALKHGLGTLEIDDQVEILTEVANRSGIIDMSRIALLGWSYGGYMALLGLAQRPDIFKVSVAGAPVTVWSLYDTAYTERYMGLPQFHQDAYLRSSVLSYVDRLPSESGRLLLLHGLIDENVHFRHTSTLVSALLRAGKPYQMQVFPTDRHAVRTPEVTEHMDATVLDFLQRNL